MRILNLAAIFVGILVTTVVFFSLTPDWWGPRVVQWFQAPESRVQSDAIIVLGGNTLARAQLGIQLFRQGVAPRLVITGASSPPSALTPEEAELAGKLAVSQGVPENAITLVASTSTLDDAEKIAQYSSQNGLKRVTLVSDWLYGRRAVCTVSQALAAGGVAVSFVSSQLRYSPETWWQSLDGREAVFTEFTKTIYHVFINHAPMWNCWAGDMNTPLLLGAWIFSCLSSFGIILAVRRWALTNMRVDIPNGRSSHTSPTPRGGGVGIAVVTLLFFMIWLVTATPGPTATPVVYMATGAIIAAMGWADDLHSLLPSIRLGVQLLLTVAFLVFSGTVTSVAVPIWGIIDLGNWLGWMVSLMWTMGFTNAFNFMDGIDGLAGVQAIIAGLAWCFLLLLDGQTSLAFLAGLIAFTSLGFLVLNAPPARIFMGDVGSTFLGFTLAVLPIMAYQNTQNSRLLLTGVLFVAPFVFDSTLTLVRRALNKENILESHRSHLYQRLVKAGYSHATVTRWYGLLALVSVFAGLLYYSASDQASVLVIAILLMIYVAMPLIVKAIESRVDAPTQAINSGQDAPSESKSI